MTIRTCCPKSIAILDRFSINYTDIGSCYQLDEIRSFSEILAAIILNLINSLWLMPILLLQQRV